MTKDQTERGRSMTVSAAKLEANRRNAMRSCGPKTQAGKERSKLNAVKHGMRAATLVLLDEDAQALEDRKADWTASLLPRGAAEQRIVDDAVEYSWLRDRARRAQEARLAANIVNAGVDEAIREADEVLRLGQTRQYLCPSCANSRNVPPSRRRTRSR
jgi:hypothetical protein